MLYCAHFTGKLNENGEKVISPNLTASEIMRLEFKLNISDPEYYIILL